METQQKRYFIYVLKLVPFYMHQSNWTEETQEMVDEHFKRLQQHTESGKVILAGRSTLDIDNEDNFGVVVFESDSEEEARAFMDNDPTVEAGVMTASLFPFSLALLREFANN